MCPSCNELRQEDQEDDAAAAPSTMGSLLPLCMVTMLERDRCPSFGDSLLILPSRHILWSPDMQGTQSAGLLYAPERVCEVHDGSTPRSGPFSAQASNDKVSFLCVKQYAAIASADMLPVSSAIEIECPATWACCISVADKVPMSYKLYTSVKAVHVSLLARLCTAYKTCAPAID